MITILGTINDDIIVGSNLDEQIEGLAGSDTLYGSLGDDWLYAGDGDDYLFGGAGNDLVTGGTGNDTLVGGLGYDHLYGLAGDDTYIINIGDAPIGLTGSEYSRIYEGLNDGTDTLRMVGFDPSELLVFQSANSSYRISIGIPDGLGGYGTIRLSGSTIGDFFHYFERVEFDDGTVWDGSTGFSASNGDGGLVIVATDEANLREGSIGDDLIYLNDGSDTGFGHAGSDEIFAGEGADTIYGGAGADTLLGEAGNDVLYGGTGDDTLDGGSGVNILFGGAGDDVFIGTAGRIIGGQGSDLVNFYDFETGITVDLTQRGKQEITSDVFTAFRQVQDIIGTAYDDIIIGGNVDNYILGGRGNDSLYGGAGDDVLGSDGGRYGEMGDDLLVGGAGNDVLIGYTGDDTLDGGTGDDTMWGGNGSDVYILRAGDGTNDNTSLIYDDGSGFDTDTLRIIGLSPDQLRIWNFDDDTLAIGLEDGLGGYGLQLIGHRASGYDSGIFFFDRYERIEFDDGTVWDQSSGLGMIGLNTDQSMIGTRAGDQIEGRGGHDTIHGGDGEDLVMGGNGNDQLYGDRDDDLLKGGRGIDTLFGGFGNDTLWGGKGNDTLYGDGGSDRLLGGSGDDVINAGGTGNVLRGGTGNDILVASGSDNRLIGEDGDDQLIGSNNDFMLGGTGADVFVFGETVGHSTVQDFELLYDTLDLSGNSYLNDIQDVLDNATEDSNGVYIATAVYEFAEGQFWTLETIFLNGLTLTDLNDINFDF